MTTAETLIAQLPQGSCVPLATLTAIAPEIDVDIRNAMAREGIVQPAGKRGPHGAYMVSWEDAALALVAVALAVVAGVAIITVARVIKESGLDPMALARDMKV